MSHVHVAARATGDDYYIVQAVLALREELAGIRAALEETNRRLEEKHRLDYGGVVDFPPGTVTS